MNKSRKMSNFFSVIIAIAFIGIVVVGGYLCYNAIVVGQNPIAIEDIQASANTIIYDKNGEVFEVIGNGNAKDTAKDFPEILENAVLAVEDKRFYDHSGVDIIRTSKVIIDTLINRSFGAGGSTITQQLVKNVTGDDEVSVSRKVREIFHAINLEQQCSKDEILTKYLNTIYLGKGNFGMVDACQAYFAKTPEELSVAEAAFMAAIIKSPETYIKDMDKANERKNLVLSYMLEQGKIDETAYNEAIDSFIEVEAKTLGGNIYSWFSESILYEFAIMYANTHNLSYSEALDKVMSGGYQIYSTVDPDLQADVYQLAKNMEIGDAQSASIVLNKQGEVIACTGAVGKKRSNLDFNRAVQTRRQPGSAIKPLAVYGPALENDLISTMSVYSDMEITYGDWTPRNFYREYYGNMSVRRALAMSNNTIPIQLLNEMGPAVGISYLNKMGFDTKSDDKALTLAIGAVSEGYTLPEMASGYQAILNEGTWCEPVFFTKIVSKSGSVIYNSKMQEKKKVFSEDTAYILTDMLRSVVESEDGTAKSLAINGMQIAAKTGTTSNNRDKWCCAFNAEYVVVTWCGYDKGTKELNVSSSYIQKHVRNIIKATNSHQMSFNVPETVQFVDICATTNSISNGHCEATYTEVVKTSMTMNTCSCEGTIVDIVEDWWNDIQDNETVEEEVNNFFNGIGNLFGNHEVGEEVTEEIEETESYTEEEYFEQSPYYEEEIPIDTEVYEEVYY